ncbi:hypothetical protein L7F22_006419 [Adiantum nelumboides]|nr:hypothetical protein [Adiantum nelumboides]
MTLSCFSFSSTSHSISISIQFCLCLKGNQSTHFFSSFGLYCGEENFSNYSFACVLDPMERLSSVETLRIVQVLLFLLVFWHYRVVSRSLDSDPGARGFAVELDTASFNSSLWAAPARWAIVEFYAHWCPACRNYKPQYERVARLFNGADAVHPGIVFMAKVDCAVKSNVLLCDRFKVSHYPTLLWGQPSNFAWVSGESTGWEAIENVRKAELLLQFINNKIGKAFTLDDTISYDNHLLSGDGLDFGQVAISNFDIEEATAQAMDIILSEKVSSSGLRVDWGFLEGSLARMGFPEAWIRGILALYRSASSSVTIGGHVGRAFQISRSVRQGCPLAPYLFLFVAETMSDFIRAQQPALRGLLMPVDDEPDLIDQEYADDTLLFLHHSHDVLDTIQYALEVFCVASGARINWDKSYGILAGSDDVPHWGPSGFTWLRPGETCRYLGFQVGMDVTPEQHFSPIMQSMRKKLSYWSTQHLSLAGRA